MKKYPVVLDLETKHTFREFDEQSKLGISVSVIYDYATSQAIAFLEKELPLMFPYLEHASYIIGYNINSFDLPVLQPYYPGKIEHLHTFDILEDIRRIIGRRLALNDVAAATLNKKKSGHGLMAIDYYREGKIDELKKYCTDDVMITKELFEFGARTSEINYRTETGTAVIKVDWKKYLDDQGGDTAHLTLPF